MTENLALGIDVGGTKIAFVISDTNGKIFHEQMIATNATDPAAQTLDRIAEQVESFVKEYPAICGIGIGIPGPIDTQQGIALNAVNLGWQNVAIVGGLQRRLSVDLPVYVENDVNVGAIGEILYGIAQPDTDFIYLAIGTGLGGCAVINKQFLVGANFSAMEIGHVSLNPQGRLCTCGQRGCVEMSISGKGVVSAGKAYYAQYPDTKLPANEITSHNILRLAKENDPLCLAVLREAGETLGIACAWCVMLFNPTQIILGGGFAHVVHDLIIEQTIQTIQERSLPASYNNVDIVLSKLTNAALGASALVWHNQT